MKWRFTWTATPSDATLLELIDIHYVKRVLWIEIAVLFLLSVSYASYSVVILVF